jgi:hypothetical protein
MVQFCLKVAQIGLNRLLRTYFAEKGLVEISAEEASWDVTSHLGQDSEVAQRVKKIELIEGVGLFLDDYSLIPLPY